MAMESITDKLNRLVRDLRDARVAAESQSHTGMYLGVGATVRVPQKNGTRLISIYATDIANGIELILTEANSALPFILQYRSTDSAVLSYHTTPSRSLSLALLRKSCEFGQQKLSFRFSPHNTLASREEIVFIDNCLRHAICLAATYTRMGDLWKIAPQKDIRLPVRDFNKRLPNHSNAFKLWLNYRNLKLPPEQQQLATGLPYKVHHIKGNEFEGGVSISVAGKLRDLADTRLYPQGPLLRIHSACCFSEQGRRKGYVANLERDTAYSSKLSSDKYAFTPYRAKPSDSCDCRLQMEESQRQIALRGGIFADFYEQEGRGYGLLNKEAFFYRFYEQEGWDTVEVCERYGINPDVRTYDKFVEWLLLIGIRRVQLLGNNPRKSHALQKAGIKVNPIGLCLPTKGNIDYLKVKRDRLHHTIPSNEELEKQLILNHGRIAHKQQPSPLN